MRIEEYTRELADFDNGGFSIMGNNRDWNSHDSSKCTPIKMALTCSEVSGNPIGSDWNQLIQLADSSCFADRDLERNMYSEFRKHYPEIMRGECPDWQLGAFRVFYGGIYLDYGNCCTGENGFLWVIGARNLRLTFETPRTRLGFDPIYRVSIDCEDDGQSVTLVEEDLGYLRREIRFEIKDPCKKTNIFHVDNQILHVTEYAGI